MFVADSPGPSPGELRSRRGAGFQRGERCGARGTWNRVRNSLQTPTICECSMLVQAPVQSGTLSGVLGAPRRPSPPLRSPRVHAIIAVNRRPSLQICVRSGMSEGARLEEPSAAGNLKRPAILGCLACVIADVRGLWLEIWSFAKCSAAACESGRTPWVQAAFTGWSGLDSANPAQEPVLPLRRRCRRPGDRHLGCRGRGGCG